jgi:HD-like signal output (HDOD) protein
VLFVDDEQNILDGLQNRLRKYRREMDMVFALSADAALSELSKTPADVIVADMRMPGMDGAALLERVKTDFPATIRIILSGYSDRVSTFRALPVAHQFFSKPCNVDKLCITLKHAFRLRTLLGNDSMREALGRIDRLPSLPTAYGELMHACAESDFSVQRIADIIESDSAMCTKLLQLVNSGYFGGNRDITSVKQAVAYLGVDLIRNLILSADIFTASEQLPACPGFSFKKLQTHSLLTARVARSILPDQAADVFTAALLHDIGYNVFACSDPEKFQRVIELRADTARPASHAETEVFGLTHSTAGAYLLGLWGLPLPFIEVAAYHHNPAAANEQGLDLPTAVSIADALVTEAVEGETRTHFPAALVEHLDVLGLLSHMQRWKEAACKEIDGWKDGAN